MNHIPPQKGIPCESEFAAVGISPLSAQEMIQLVSVWQQGAIGSEALFHNFKAGERLPDDMDMKSWQRDVTDNGPDAGDFQEQE